MPSRPEEHRGYRGAALRHALAGALQRLGLRRLQETAGQPAVRGVAGELLQPGVVIVVEVDVEVPEPGDRQPVVRQLLVGRGMAAASMSGLCMDMPRIGQAPVMSWVVIEVLATFSSCCATQPVTASLFVTSTVPTRLRISLVGIDDAQGVLPKAGA